MPYVKSPGVASMRAAMHVLCRLVRKYGTYGVSLKLSPAIASAMLALDAACRAWENLDNYPGETDSTLGGYEDDPNNLPLMP